MMDWGSIQVTVLNDNGVVVQDEYSYSLKAEQRMVIFGGEQGPAGPVGPRGPQGPEGPQGPSGGVWGNIVGDMSTQTDLMTALNAKANTSSLGTMATVNDAPSDSKEYARKNGAWAEVVGGGAAEPVTVYVNASTGSDDNDGTEESPFATIGKAVTTVPTSVSEQSTIYIAAGTYSGQLEIEAQSIIFSLQGNVSQTGAINVIASSYVYIGGASGATMTISGGVTVSSESYLETRNAVSISTQYAYALNVSSSRFVNTSSGLTLTSTYSSGAGVNAGGSSLVYLGYVAITADNGIISIAGSVVGYHTLTGTMTTSETTASGGRIYTGSESGGGGTEWGDITGTLADQTDLQNALNEKANSADLGTISAANYTISHTDLTSGTSPLPTGDLYFYW